MRALSKLIGRSTLIAAAASVFISAPLLAQAAPSMPTVITPLKVQSDGNGVNIVRGKARVDQPSITIPAAPRLNYDLVQKLMPHVVVHITGDFIDTMKSAVAVEGVGQESESFTCNGDHCTNQKRNGSTFTFSNIGGPYTYTEAGSGAVYTFNSLEYDTGFTQPERQVQYYGTSVAYPDGETLSLTYQTANYASGTGPTRHRLTQISSNIGYHLTFTYQGNDVNYGAWFAPAQATAYKSGASTPLAQLSYATSGAITDIAGRTFTCLYGCINAVGQPVDGVSATVTLPTETNPAKVVASSYPGGWSVVTSVTQDGVPWTYSYGNIRAAYAPLDYTYDSVTVDGPAGYHQVYNITAGQANTPSLINAVVDSNGRTTSYVYDGYYRPTRMTLPEGNYVNVTYDAYGNIISKLTQPKVSSGQTALSESAAINATNCATTPVLCYRVTSYTDALSRTTSYTYDTAGRLTSEIAPADSSGVQRAKYLSYSTSFTSPTEVRICALGSTCGTTAEFKTQYTYQGNTALPLTETQIDGVAGTSLTTTYTYDAAGRVLSVDGPLAGSGDARYFRYDVVGRKTWEIGPVNADGSRPATKYTHRDADDKVIATDTGVIANQYGTTFYGAPAVVHVDTSYDAHSNPNKVATSSGGTTYQVGASSYDDRGQLTCSTVRMNAATFGSLPSDACTLGTQGSYGPDRITRNTYDAAGQLLKVQKAYGTSLQQDYVTYTYTNNGKQASVKDANGNLASLTYDGFDRQNFWYLPSKTTPGVASTTDYEQYGYDAVGNRTSLRKRDGVTLTYSYDNLNRVIVKNVPTSASGAAGYSVYTGYDVRGLQLYASFGSTSGQGVTNAYDGYGRLTTSTSTMGGVSRTTGYAYGANSAPTRLDYPDGQHANYFRDVSGRVYYAAWQDTAPLLYPHYDNLGRSAALYRYLASNWNWGAPTSYGYDGIGRLASQTHDPAGSAADTTNIFGYNPASQIVSWDKSNAAYAYPDAAKSLAYTVNGLNQYAAVNSNAYTYDANGNLTSDGGQTLVYDAENRLVSATGAHNATLSYDPLGRLWQVYSPATGTTQFAYDGDAMIAEYDGSGNMLRRYVHSDAADDPLVWYEGSQTTSPRYLYADRQGSIVAVTDAGGNPLVIDQYDEWGVPSAQTLSVAQRFGYTGQAWLPELGMYYYKARIYAPQLGRFLQTDPIGYKDQINLYAYVGNDAINASDPEGLFACKDKSACDAAKEGIAEIKAAKEYYSSPQIGSLIARNQNAANALGKQLSALGSENDGKGPNIALGKPEGSGSVSGEFDPKTNTITLNRGEIKASGFSIGEVLAHETEHYRLRFQNFGNPDQEARPLGIQYLMGRIPGGSLVNFQGNMKDYVSGRLARDYCHIGGAYAAACGAASYNREKDKPF